MSAAVVAVDGLVGSRAARSMPLVAADASERRDDNWALALDVTRRGSMPAPTFARITDRRL